MHNKTVFVRMKQNFARDIREAALGVWMTPTSQPRVKVTKQNKGRPDLGLLSFGSVIVTTTYLLALVDHHIPLSKNDDNNNNNHTTIRTLVIGSHLLVTLNYAGGAYLGYYVAKNVRYGLYCTTFTLLWFVLTVNVSNGMNQ